MGMKNKTLGRRSSIDFSDGKVLFNAFSFLPLKGNSKMQFLIGIACEFVKKKKKDEKNLKHYRRICVIYNECREFYLIL